MKSQSRSYSPGLGRDKKILVLNGPVAYPKNRVGRSVLKLYFFF